MPTNICAMHITDHAADQYTDRVLHQRVVFDDPRLLKKQRGRAKACIVVRMRSAVLLETGMHDGCEQRAWQLAGCVATEKRGCITTILSPAMYAHGLRSDT